MTGWNLPPGVTYAMIDDIFDDQPCDVCGQYTGVCVCPECPICGSYGDPNCYDHLPGGHGLVRSPEQVELRSAAERRWQEEWAAESAYAEEMARLKELYGDSREW
jgi:hypothetical protein